MAQSMRLWKDAAGNITAPIEVGTLKIDSVKPDVAMEIVNAVWKTISEKIFFITNKDVTVKVTVSDATSDIEDVQISIDGGETFSSLGNHAGEYLVTLKAEHRDAIEVNGNFTRVTVSQNALVIFYANKPVFFGTLGGLAALIILIVVLLKKKKEKK